MGEGEAMTMVGGPVVYGSLGKVGISPVECMCNTGVEQCGCVEGSSKGTNSKCVAGINM